MIIVSILGLVDLVNSYKYKKWRNQPIDKDRLDNYIYLTYLTPTGQSMTTTLCKLTDDMTNGFVEDLLRGAVYKLQVEEHMRNVIYIEARDENEFKEYLTKYRDSNKVS
jgi:hypothetical protein